MKWLKWTAVYCVLNVGLAFGDAPPAAPSAPGAAPAPASSAAFDPNSFKVFVYGDSNANNYGPYVVSAIDSTQADYGPFNVASVKNDDQLPDFFVHYKSLMGKCAKDSVHFMASDRKNDGLYEPLPGGVGYDVVIYQMGTNDSAHRADFPSDDAYVAAVRQGMTDGIGVLRTIYKAKTVYIALPPPIFGPQAQDEASSLVKKNWSNVSLNKLLPMMRDVGDKTGCKIIDVNAAFQGHEKDFGRGVHYGPPGRTVVAQMYIDAIRGDITPIKFYDGTTELTAIKPGTITVKTSYINNTLPAKYRPKLMAVLYRDDGGGSLTAVQTKSLDELVTPTTPDVSVTLDVPAGGKYVIKTFCWRDAAMTTPNNFATPYLSTLQ